MDERPDIVRMREEQNEHVFGTHCDEKRERGRPVVERSGGKGSGTT